MSLASYFTKKSGPKAARVNLTVVSESGENKSVTINSVASSTRKEITSNDAEKVKPVHEVNSLHKDQAHNDHFVFGFSVDEATTSASKKRRQRQKNKNKQHENLKQHTDQATIILEQSSDIRTNNRTIETEKFIESAPQFAQSLKQTPSTNEDIYKKNDNLHKSTQNENHSEIIHDNSTPLQPPPGLDSQVIENATLPLNENSSIPTNALLRPNDKFRKTPGKKTSKKNKKTSVARQMQLDELNQRKNEKIIRPKQQEMKLQFNAVTKSKAMVNRGSLAVHREKTKHVGKQEEQPVQEVNPFSFGFNFNTLLNVPDNSFSIGPK
jgi:hypothetical protein